MKIGYFSPLPPAASGVADYSATLLGELRKAGNVEIAPEHFDVALYHIGNNQLHGDIYARALARPGVVVLHDTVLTHFLLGALLESQWIDEFVYNYGAWLRGFAQDLWRNRAQSGADPRYFAYPMLQRISETARAVIVHNPASAAAVLRHAPAARVVEIPHLWNSISPLHREPTRRHPSGPLRVGVLGYLRESKRLPVILRALERARSGGADIELIIAGSFASSDLERAVRPRLAAGHIRYTGHLTDDQFLRAAQWVDVCINLRYPSANETSGIGVRLMGLGKTVIFTEGPELARFPELACLRLEHGPDEEEALAEYLIWLAGNREMGPAIGERAARHIAQQHSLALVAAQYWRVLGECASST